MHVPNTLDRSTYRVSSVLRRRFFRSKTIPKNLDPSYKTDLDRLGLLGKDKIRIKSKFQRTDSVICSNPREGGPRLIAE